MNPVLFFMMAALSSVALTSHATTKHPAHAKAAGLDSDLLFQPDDMADAELPAPVLKKHRIKSKAAAPTESAAARPDCVDCAKPVSAPDPLDIFKPIVKFLRFDPDPLTLTGRNMSCAQEQLLESAKYRARAVYNNRISRGQCGPAVGDDITMAGIPFSPIDRYGVKFANLLPKYGFKRTKARSVAEAPEGSVLVFAGPCSAQYRNWIAQTFHEYCEPNRSEGETWGHVTIKGSPRQDHGQQWYYTDGRTDWATNRDRRFFVGAFLPPGWEKGPCHAG